MRRAYDAVVVGAGVAGTVAARELASDHDVLVLDPASVGAGATGRSAGLIAPSLFFGEHLEMARHMNEFFRAFDGTGQFRFTERDRVDLVAEGEDGGAKAARADAERRRDAGFPVEYIGASTVRERYPQIRTDGFVGAIEYRDTGWIDPYSYANALAESARERGATIETGTPATGIVTEADSVSGVETPAGRVQADKVVAAAGWRTRKLLAEHFTLPVRPYRTQCLVLDPDEPLAPDFPLIRVGSEHLYMRPEHNGDLLVGGGQELLEESEAETADTDTDAEFRRQVAEQLPDIVEGFEHAGIVNGWAGIDGGTPDAYPIIDAPSEAPDGLAVATGFNGLGIMLSPVVGPAIRQLLLGDPAPFALSSFELDRFDDRHDSFTIRSTSDV